MYMLRPFPGRVRPDGVREYAGFYCWFAAPNEKFTRDYGGSKLSFKLDPDSNNKNLNSSPASAQSSSRHSPALHFVANASQAANIFSMQNAAHAFSSIQPLVGTRRN